MTVPSQTPNLEAGSFCWADVAAGDPTSTHKFFSQLFGWKRKVRPTEDAQAYSIMTLGGCNVAGICGVEVDAPNQWMSYLLVDDLIQATERAVALGAKTLRENIEIPRFGTMTVIEDPVGAVLALWQTREKEAPSSRKHGTVSWFELITESLDEAANFYCRLTGWSKEFLEVGQSRHIVFTQRGEEKSGMMRPLRPENKGRSFWLVYFSVDDCDEAARRCEELGGGVVDSPYEIEGVGRCAIVTDPSGGSFGIVEYH